jgi:hypothetical protein
VGRKPIHRVSDIFMSTFQYLIPEAISNQKCHVTMGPIFSGYGDMDI